MAALVVATEWLPRHGDLQVTLVQRDIACVLKKYGQDVYYMVLQAGEEDTADAEKHGVTLVTPDEIELVKNKYPTIDWLMLHKSIYPNIRKLNIAVILGHVAADENQTTANAAKQMQAEIFRAAKFVPIFHTIPADMITSQRKAHDLERNMLELAEGGNPVVSVGPKVWNYFSNRVPNKDDHICYLPFVDESICSLQLENIFTGKTLEILSYYFESSTKSFDEYRAVASAIGNISTNFYIHDKLKIKWKFATVKPINEFDEFRRNIYTLSNEARYLDVSNIFFESLSEICKIIQESHIMVHGLRNDSFGLPAIMACTAGVPTVITSNNGFAEFLQENFLSYAEHYVVPVGQTHSEEDVLAWENILRSLLRKYPHHFENTKKLKILLRESAENGKIAESHRMFAEKCSARDFVQHQMMDQKFAKVEETTAGAMDSERVNSTANLLVSQHEDSAIEDASIGGVSGGSVNVFPMTKKVTPLAGNGQAFPELLLAALDKDISKIMILIESGEDINAVNQDHYTCLHIAAAAGDLTVAKYVTEAGIDKDKENKDKMTALMLAVKNNRRDVAKFLVDSGAELNSQDKAGHTCLHHAAAAGYLHIVEILIKAGADKGKRDMVNATPVHLASHFGHLDIVKVLIEACVDKDTKGTLDGTPLMYAAGNGCSHVVRYLIEVGADIGAVTTDKDSPLHFATQNGEIEVVRTLVNAGADVNACNNDGHTPLIKAASNGHSDTGRYLIGNGADIHAVTKDKYTPLHCAAQNGHTEIAEDLVEAGAIIKSFDKWGNTPLHRAVLGCYHDIVKIFIEAGVDVDVQGQDKYTPLHCAAQKGHTEIAKILVKAGANMEARDKWSNTPVHRAVLGGYCDMVKVFIESGVDKDVQGQDKYTPLHCAAQRGHTEIAKILVEAGADMEARDKWNNTPVHRAVLGGYRDMVKVFIESGVDKDVRGQDEYTPLHCAAQDGQTDVAKMLIEVGASMESRTSKGFTPLHHAAQNGHKDVAETLIGAKANIEALTKDKNTSLSLAAIKGHTDVVRILIDAGANKEARDQYNYTPLIWAAREGHQDVVRILIDAGAKKEARDQENYTPLILAARKGHTDVVRILIDAGANIEAGDKDNYTPLIWAANEGHLHVVKILIESGANKEACDQEQYSITEGNATGRELERSTREEETICQRSDDEEKVEGVGQVKHKIQRLENTAVDTAIEAQEGASCSEVDNGDCRNIWLIADKERQLYQLPSGFTLEVPPYAVEEDTQLVVTCNNMKRPPLEDYEYYQSDLLHLQSHNIKLKQPVHLFRKHLNIVSNTRVQIILMSEDGKQWEELKNVEDESADGIKAVMTCFSMVIAISRPFQDIFQFDKSGGLFQSIRDRRISVYIPEGAVEGQKKVTLEVHEYSYCAEGDVVTAFGESLDVSFAPIIYINRKQADTVDFKKQIKLSIPLPPPIIDVNMEDTELCIFKDATDNDVWRDVTNDCPYTVEDDFLQLSTETSSGYTVGRRIKDKLQRMCDWLSTITKNKKSGRQTVQIILMQHKDTATRLRCDLVEQTTRLPVEDLVRKTSKYSSFTNLEYCSNIMMTQGDIIENSVNGDVYLKTGINKKTFYPNSQNHWDAVVGRKSGHETKEIIEQMLFTRNEEALAELIFTIPKEQYSEMEKRPDQFASTSSHSCLEPLIMIFDQFTKDNIKRAQSFLAIKSVPRGPLEKANDADSLARLLTERFKTSRECWVTMKEMLNFIPRKDLLTHPDFCQHFPNQQQRGDDGTRRSGEGAGSQ